MCTLLLDLFNPPLTSPPTLPRFTTTPHSLPTSYTPFFLTHKPTLGCTYLRRSGVIWKMVDLPRNTLLNRTCLSFPKNYQPPITPQVGMGTWEASLIPCQNVNWLDLVWVSSRDASFFIDIQLKYFSFFQSIFYSSHI